MPVVSMTTHVGQSAFRYRWTVLRLTPRASAISVSFKPLARSSVARFGLAWVVPTLLPV